MEKKTFCDLYAYTMPQYGLDFHICLTSLMAIWISFFFTPHSMYLPMVKKGVVKQFHYQMEMPSDYLRCN